MKSQTAQLKVATSSKCKMAASIYSEVWQFLWNSVHQRSVLLQMRYSKPTCKWTQTIAQGWQLKSESLLLLSLETDTSMVRERCWLLHGKATQQIKQQTENKSDNCILSTIICIFWTRLRDKKFKSSHQTFSAGGRGQLGMLNCHFYNQCACTIPLCQLPHKSDNTYHRIGLSGAHRYLAHTAY